MDPLSDVLSLMKLRSFWSAGFDAGGDWSLAFPASDGIRFYTALQGSCWLAVEGVPDSVHICAGDCLVLPRGRAFRVASDLALKPIDPTSFPMVEDGGVTRYNGGGDFFSVGGQFTLTGEHADMLIDMLPPIVHIHDEPDKELLRWCVDRMRKELRDPQPGGFVFVQQLAMMLLVATLRLHLADGAEARVGWLYALSDPRMAAAITAMHQTPAERWTLQSLAMRAGMSRTAFTLKFRETVGASPMEYLSRWRMRLASDRLANGGDSVAEIAYALGYESESAFSTAFKRIVGYSPRQYVRRLRLAPLAASEERFDVNDESES